MMELGSIVVGSFAILGIAALIGIIITTIVPYFIEGRSIKRQKQYSLLSLVITVTFIGTLANGFISSFMTKEEGLAVTQVGTILTVVSLVFVFLQDGVTVMVAAAAGLRDHTHIHDLLKLTIWGGPLFGAAVMVLLILMYFIPPVLPLFIPDPSIREVATTYYLIEAFNTPFVFLRMISIGFLLGTERISLWLKLQSIYVVFSFFWNVIFVYAGRLGPTGSAVADFFSGLWWLIMIVYVLKKEYGEAYPITATNLFTLDRTVTKNALRVCGNLITRDIFWCLATILPLLIANMDSFSVHGEQNDHASSQDNHVDYSKGLLRATTITSRAVAVMTLSTLFFQGYAPYLAYIGRYRGARLLSKPMAGKSREFRRLALSLIIQGAVVGAVSLVGASIGHTLIPKLIVKYALDAEPQTEAVLRSLQVVWWVLVAEITATNLNNVYGSLVWAAQDFTFVRTISISSFFFIYLPPLIIGYLSGSLIGLWVAVCGYTFFQLCCYAWRVHTRVLVTPLHMDQEKLNSFAMVMRGSSIYELDEMEADADDDYGPPGDQSHHRQQDEMEMIPPSKNAMTTNLLPPSSPKTAAATTNSEKKREPISANGNTNNNININGSNSNSSGKTNSNVNHAIIT
jgi:Na+-driven multidrug efflux pump